MFNSDLEESVHRLKDVSAAISEGQASLQGRDCDIDLPHHLEVVMRAACAPTPASSVLVGEAEPMADATLAELEDLRRQVAKYKPFQPEWIYVSTGELPPLQTGSWGPNGNFMSYEVLITIQTPEHSWVVKGRRNLNCPDEWDCGEAHMYPEVRKIVAWAWPDKRWHDPIPPAARIELPATETVKGGQPNV